MQKADAALDKITADVRVVRAKAIEAETKAKGSKHKATLAAAVRARAAARKGLERKKQATIKAREARMALRTKINEAKATMAEQELLSKIDERKEAARAKAVAAFTAKWERAYDRSVAAKLKKRAAKKKKPGRRGRPPKKRS